MNSCILSKANIKVDQCTNRASYQSGGCGNSLAGPFAGGASYCADIPNAIFLKGNGEYDNMDTDCDGADNTAGDCGNDQTGQSQTSFQDLAQSYGISDLNANIHSYVVFGNEGSRPSFNPQAHGIKPLSVMAVVCDNQVVRLVLMVAAMRCIGQKD